MLTRIRWFALESLDNIVLGRRGQKATGFVSLKERKANKAKEKEGKASSSKMKDDEAEDNRLAIETAVQDRSAKSDEVEWFKGGDYECLKKVFVPEDRGGPGYITRRLQSKPPTDFSREFGDTYWAKTLQLAEVYADFHQARNKGDILTGILHIIIPKATVESATQFKETKHWNEYVWLNSIDMIHIPGTPISELILLV